MAQLPQLLPHPSSPQALLTQLGIQMGIVGMGVFVDIGI